MEEYNINKQISVIEEKPEEVEEKESLFKDSEFCEINKLYDECLTYLKQESVNDGKIDHDPDYESIKDKYGSNDESSHDDENTDENNDETNNEIHNGYDKDEEVETKTVYKIENELISNDSINTITSEPRSERLRKLSQQLPKIIITQTQSNTSLNTRKHENTIGNAYFKRRDVNNTDFNSLPKINQKYEFKHNNVKSEGNIHKKVKSSGKHYSKADVKKMIENGKKPVIIEKDKLPRRPGQEYPKRLVSKRGVENVALISNVPFERIRLLNDTFHTLINLRWRWIVTGTIVVHFTIWLVFAVFWYITALAHYDFDPNPPKKTCVTGGHDFLTIFLASVEAQTTIGFGDRAIDEECPESIFLFIMQLILGTGLSGVLTCVVYAKLTRPEKLSRDGVGFSKKAVISTRDGRLCLMMRAWDLNYDHIISSEFRAHFVHTHRTKEGEVIRYYAQTLALQQRQFLLWPVTLLHVIDRASPLYSYGPDLIANNNYEITVSLKGASASMGTFTQSQTSYLPREVVWGHRFPPVVKYDSRKQKYVIDHKKLDAIEPVDTPFCSAEELACESTKRNTAEKTELPICPGSPGSFSDRISSFHLERSSSFRRNTSKSMKQDNIS